MFWPGLVFSNLRHYIVLHFLLLRL